MEERLAEPRITIRENGPYRVEGDVPLFDHLGNQIQPPKPDGYSLCRCGASSKKPFCDGTHRTSGFDGTCVRIEIQEAKKEQPGS